jgi:hypothetical protein
MAIDDPPSLVMEINQINRIFLVPLDRPWHGQSHDGTAEISWSLADSISDLKMALAMQKFFAIGIMVYLMPQKMLRYHPLLYHGFSQ